MELTDRIWLLMARALNHEASSQELDELSDLLRHDPSLQQQYELLTRIWHGQQHAADPSEDEAETITRIINKATPGEVSEDVRSSRMRRRNRRLLVSSVIVILLVTLFISLWPVSRTAGMSATIQVPEELVAKKGSRIRSQLPDGTTVWLNAGSRLIFVNDFTGNTREVRLEGEAFFDVVKQLNRPFIVHIAGYNINVLGTAFNVKSYPEEKVIETTLLRGRVQIVREAAPASEAIELKPNYKLILPTGKAVSETANTESVNPAPQSRRATFTITPIDTTKKENELHETAWLYSRLEFRGDSFEQLSSKLERWYNVKIVFTSETVKQLHFNGSFERETVQQAFMALQAAVPYFKYQITPDEIYVGTPE